MAIDVFGGLSASVGIARGQRGSFSRRGGAKVTVQFTGDKLVFEPQEKQIARELAETLTKIFREYMLDGRWINGIPLPTVDGKTVARRAYRVLQITDGTSKRGKQRLERRYRTKKLGTTLPDAATSGRNLVGLESGTLARSISVAPFSKGMRIFVADIRGKIGRSGDTPWLRVLRKMGGIGSLETVLADGRVQAAMNNAWRSCWALNGKRLGAELAKTVALLQGIAAEAEQLAEQDGAAD